MLKVQLVFSMGILEGAKWPITMGRSSSAQKIMDFYKFLAGPSKSGFKELEKWKVKKNMLSLLSEKWKVNFFGFHCFSKSEMKVTRDREVRFFENFSGNLGNQKLWLILVSKISPKCDLKKCKVDFAPMISHLMMQDDVFEVELVVADNQSDSIQCLNFAKKWFIQYSIQYCFT